MPSDLRPIRMENLEDLVRVVNESSKGYLFQFDLDLYGFLALSRFWNLSYQHSFLAYADGRPAGVLLNSVDPEAMEAFSFYWGVLPEFRRGRIAMSLVAAYFRLLRREGYNKTDADETVGSPTSVYGKLGYRRNEIFAEIQTDHLDVSSASDEFELRSIDPDQLVRSWSGFTGFRHWVQRPNFLRQSRKFIEILAAFKDAELCGYAVFTSLPGRLVICDFRFNARESGLAILRRIQNSSYPSPYVASFVPSPSPAYDLLQQAGFAGSKRFNSLTLEFSSSGSEFVRQTAG